MADPVAVEFEAEVRQLKTMADHSVNLTLNVPEYCVEQVQTMLMWLGDMVQIVAVDEPDSRHGTGNGRARRKRTVSEGD
jgi:hypothetical protein